MSLKHTYTLIAPFYDAMLARATRAARQHSLAALPAEAGRVLLAGVGSVGAEAIAKRASSRHGLRSALCGLALGFALMGIAFGPIGAFLPELFDANVRYSGSGIGYNLAAIVGAAFVPTIATWLSHHWGVHSVGLYLGVMALCCLIAVLSCKETKNVDFTK